PWANPQPGLTRESSPRRPRLQCSSSPFCATPSDADSIPVPLSRSPLKLRGARKAGDLTGNRPRAELPQVGDERRARAWPRRGTPARPGRFGYAVPYLWGRPVSTWVANLQGRTEVQCPRKSLCKTIVANDDNYALAA